MRKWHEGKPCFRSSKQTGEAVVKGRNQQDSPVLLGDIAGLSGEGGLVVLLLDEEGTVVPDDLPDELGHDVRVRESKSEGRKENRRKRGVHKHSARDRRDPHPQKKKKKKKAQNEKRRTAHSTRRTTTNATQTHRTHNKPNAKKTNDHPNSKEQQASCSFASRELSRSHLVHSEAATDSFQPTHCTQELDIASPSFTASR